jgi:hypothetical protein
MRSYSINLKMMSEETKGVYTDDSLNKSSRDKDTDRAARIDTKSALEHLTLTDRQTSTSIQLDIFALFLDRAGKTFPYGQE